MKLNALQCDNVYMVHLDSLFVSFGNFIIYL